MKGQTINFSGLSEAEAAQRVVEGKTNNTKKIKTNSIPKIIAKDVFSFVNIILIVIAAVLFSFGLWTNFGFVVVFGGNLVISIYSDVRAKLAVDKLSLLTESRSIVVRDSKEIEIVSKEIVLDDIIKIKQGDVLPCDGVVLEGFLVVDESILTGEADTVLKEKDAKVLSGTTVMSGTAYIKAEKVGNDSFINQLEKQTKTFHSTRPELYKQINLLFKFIMIVVVVLGVAQGISVGIRNSDISGYSDFAKRIVEPIAGSILSLIPSGLYFLFSSTLGVGVLNLSKKNILVQELYSLDVLSRVDVICIDKTGTITDSSMTVTEFEYFEKNSGLLEGFSEYFGSFLANSSDSNATNLALRKYFKENSTHKCVAELPFDSANKFSAIEFDDGNVLAVGAYEFLVATNKCDKFKDILDKKASEGYRVLAFAFGKGKIDKKKLSGDLEIKGYIALSDNIKTDAKEIIKYFKDKGVKVLIVSGDNNLTLKRIAEDVELSDNVNSIDLTSLGDKKIAEVVDDYNVFGRVTPEQKREIVKALKEKGHTVAMFGDGVNDILAFKEANISLSVASGTPAARSLAKIIFMDNNFGGMVEVVKEGRRVINNLQRTASLFLVKTTFAAIMNTFFIVTSFTRGISWPFIPGSFYIWEIGFIGMTSFFLSLEPKYEKIEGNFLKNILSQAVPQGVIVALGTMIVYIYMISTNFYAGNADIHRAVATMVMNLTGSIILIRTCLPINRYRFFVILAGFGIAIGILVWSIFGVDWMALYPKEPPRVLSGDALLLTVIGISSIITTLLIYYLIIYFVKKRREKIHG